MQPWEYERNRFLEAEPGSRRAPLGWERAERTARERDEQLRSLWASTVPESGAPVCLMIAAVAAMENRGYRVRDWEAAALQALHAAESAGQGDMDALIRAHIRVQRAINRAEVDRSSSYWSKDRYSSYGEFLRRSRLADAESAPSSRPALAPDEDAYRSKVRGCWIGQAVGGALGTPLEGYTSSALKQRYGDITGYVTDPNPMNDDLTYQIAFLQAVGRHGAAVTSDKIAAEWAALIPYGWSAEAVALENILNGTLPPDSAMQRNPFSDWIGAQMRGAAPGLIAPGDSRLAARLAWLDAAVSHTANGILGEVFNAVMTAAAFVETDVRRVVSDAVDAIPAETEYGEVVRYALYCCTSWGDPATALARCDEGFARYHWVHSYPNACIEIIALWYGNGDFDATARIVAGAGYDVDCNAAQALGILGAMHTDAAIPTRWVEPLGSQIATYCRGIPEISFDALVDLTVTARKSLISATTGDSQAPENA